MSTIKAENIAKGANSTDMDNAIFGSVKAWARFNGSGTAVIDKSHNITSLTDEGTGQYIFNFTTAMSNDDYAGLIGSRNINDDLTTHSNGTRYASITAVSATQVRVTGFICSSNSFSDMDRVSFAILDK